jgi:hypothetical protein
VNISLQELYWIVMMAFGLIATGINIVLYVRNKPDKIKAAIQAAIEPMIHRLEVVEHNQSRQDADIKLVNSSIVRMESTIKHMPQREEYSRLYDRITDMVGAVGNLQGASGAEAALLGRINAFLIEGSSR